MPIVSDSGTILSYARANLWDCLRDVAGELIVPYAVHEEILGDLKMPGSKTIAESVWITRQSVRDRRLVERLSARLHRGEREAIALAKELGATLLVDDREARKEASHLGIEHFGSLRILKEAKDQGILTEVRPALDELIATGTYVGKDLYQEFLRSLREPEG